MRGMHFQERPSNIPKQKTALKPNVKKRSTQVFRKDSAQQARLRVEPASLCHHFMSAVQQKLQILSHTTGMPFEYGTLGAEMEPHEGVLDRAGNRDAASASGPLPATQRHGDFGIQNDREKPVEAR